MTNKNILSNYAKFLKTKQCFIQRNEKFQNLLNELKNKSFVDHTTNKRFKIIKIRFNSNISYSVIYIKTIKPNNKLSFFYKRLNFVDLAFKLLKNQIEMLED